MNELAYLDKDGNIIVTNYTDSIVGIVKKIKPNGDMIIMAKYAEDKGVPQMEACELEEK